MDKNWSKDGQKMDIQTGKRWTKGGQKMDKRWTKDGQKMDRGATSSQLLRKRRPPVQKSKCKMQS